MQERDKYKAQNFDNNFVSRFILHYDDKTVYSGPKKAGGVMKLLKRIALSGLAVTLLTGMLVFSVSAQTRVTRVRTTTSLPTVVRRIVYYPRYHRYYDPFWRGTLWDPYYYSYDPYFYDPYLSERRTRYYKEKAVRDARRDLAKAREKYGSDGYLTPKEQEKLAKKQRKYNEKVASLNKYNRNY